MGLPKMTFELCSLEGPEAGWVKTGQWPWEQGLRNGVGERRPTRERKTEPRHGAGGICGQGDSEWPLGF